MKLFKNFNKFQNLKWTKKGIYLYISYVIVIIKTISSHPIYKSIKLIFNILLTLIIAYITYLYLSLEVNNLDSINKAFLDLFQSVIRYIRDKLDNLLNEQVVSLKEDLNLLPIET